MNPRLIAEEVEKVTFGPSRKLPGLNDRKEDSIKPIQFSLRSFNPGALARSKCNFFNFFCYISSFSFFLFFLTTSSIYATTLSPWFRNVFEFEGRLGIGYDHDYRIQTPLGSFKNNRDNYHLQFGLGVSPWPHWDVEAELYLSRSPEIDIGIEAFLLTGRYLFLDELMGDLLNLAAGVTFSFPGSRFLRNLSYSYHGNVNGEIHLSLGKECFDVCTYLWSSRFWLLGGFGVSEKGSPWIHAIGGSERRFFSCFTGGIFLEALIGLGEKNINPTLPFEGYASIGHRALDIKAMLSYPLGVLGIFTLEGFYNLYARNFPEHSLGIQANLFLPFSF